MPARSETAGAAAFVLVDIALPGRVLRYTTAPEAQTVTDAASRSYRYSPGLETGPLAFEAGSASRKVRAQVPPSGADSWAKLYKRGHRFELARCTVRLHYPGQALEQAAVYLEGRLRSPTWGEGELLSFTVESEMRRSGTMPDPAMRVDATTWPVSGGHSVAEAAEGAVYPIIVGRPNAGATTPAYMVESGTTDKWLIAGHEVQATTVTLWNTSTNESTTRTVKHMDDGAGRKVAYVDSAGISGVTVDEGDEYRASWDQGGGGLYNAARDADLRGAGEGLLYLLRTYAPGIRLDSARMESQRVVLDTYRMDFGITEPVEVWPFIQSNILPILPVELVTTSSGIYFQAFRLGARKTEAVARLVSTRGDASRNCDRIGGPVGASGDIANRITLDYARGGIKQRFTKSATIGASPRDGDTRFIPSMLCRASETMLEDPDRPGSGTRPLRLSSPAIYDNATATRVLRDKAQQLALPKSTIRLRGDLDWLQLNDVILYSDDEIEASEELALVRRKHVQGHDTEVDILLIAPPGLFSRATS